MTIGSLIASLYFYIILHKVGAKPNQSPNLQKQETLALSILRVTSSRKIKRISTPIVQMSLDSRFHGCFRHIKGIAKIVFFFFFFAFFNGKDAIFRQKSCFFGKNPNKLDILQVHGIKQRQLGQQGTTSATSLILLLIVIGVVYALHEDFSIIYAVCHCLFE